MNAAGWCALAAVAVLALFYAVRLHYWRSRCAEWEARADERARTIGWLYEDRRRRMEAGR